MIPDAAYIFAARKKRQKARELGTGGDYIPLDDTQRYSNTGNKASGRDESRLIRDDDNDCSESDEEGRMSFTVKHSTSRQRMQEAIDESMQLFFLLMLCHPLYVHASIETIPYLLWYFANVALKNSSSQHHTVS